MNLTVTARLAGGAAIVIALLIAIAVTALSGVSSISDGLNAMTKKSAPMLVAGSESVSSLLKARVVVNRHHQSRDMAELAAFEDEYQQLISANQRSMSQLASLAETYPEIKNTLQKGANNIKDFMQTVPELFAAHNQDLQLGAKIESVRGDFEDTADELDSNLYDFADEVSLSSTSDALTNMSNMIREATVVVTDTLLLDDIAQVRSAVKDIGALVADLDKSRATVDADTGARANEYYSDTMKNLDRFKQLVTGDDGILQIYIKQLQTREKAKQLLTQSDEEANQALDYLNQVFQLIKHENEAIEASSQETVSSSRTMLITFAVIAIIAAVGLNFWVVTSIRAPLNEVLRVIDKASSGDLTDMAKIDSSDELGILAKGFNGLIDALRNMLREIGSSSQQLSSAAEQTAAISSQSANNINNQKEQTDMIATAMTEMAATVNEVANSANNTLQEVQAANLETTEGQKIVQESIAAINNLASEIEQAARVINKLDEYSTNIGAVLDVIRGIADQTNLLALNAAIEAARAGEQGRGFAVVADEVRTLASKTQESTSEIQEMIERLQSGTREAVSVMETSQQEAKNSVTKTESAGQSLARITKAVTVIHDMSTHIASAAEEQSAVTQEMHQNVEAISKVADETAMGAKENLQASQELARLAEHLQQLVMRFKF